MPRLLNVGLHEGRERNQEAIAESSSAETWKWRAGTQLRDVGAWAAFLALLQILATKFRSLLRQTRLSLKGRFFLCHSNGAQG